MHTPESSSSGNPEPLPPAGFSEPQISTSAGPPATTPQTAARTVAVNTGSAEPEPVKPAKPIPIGPTGHVVDENSANDTIELQLIGEFAQRVDFGLANATTSLVIDEPEPLGENEGPSPTRVLAAALASCLGASLLFCLKKARVDVLDMHTVASVSLKRNERKRLRVDTITVHLNPVVPIDQQPRMAHCLEVFEDYCVVTASVRPGITVNVSVNTIAPTDNPASDSINS